MNFSFLHPIEEDNDADGIVHGDVMTVEGVQRIDSSRREFTVSTDESALLFSLTCLRDVNSSLLFSGEAGDDMFPDDG